MSGSKRGIHYGYFIVATFCVVALTAVSFAISCGGVFFPATAETFNTTTGTMSYFMPVEWISVLISLPILGKVFDRIDIRVLESAGALLTALALVLQSLTQEAWQYMLCGIPMGVSLTICLFLAPTAIINRWFKKRAGLCVGIAMSCSGIGGAIFSALAGVLVLQIGWRVTLLIYAAITVVLCLPLTILVLRGNPADKGLAPYGSEEVTESVEKLAAEIESEGMTAKEAFRTPTFILLAIFAFGINFSMYIYQLMASYIAVQPIGISMPTLGSLVMAVAMAAQCVGKIGFGGIGDKNPLLAIIAGLICGFAGLLLLFLGKGSAVMLFAAALLFGLFYSLSNALMPILTRKFYGMREYPAIYSRISMAAALGPTLSSFVLGTVANTLGWDATFVFVAVLIAIALVAVLAAFRARKPKRA